MQKIVPHLWFDTQAKEAAKFYTSVFPDSSVTNVTVLHDTPSGDAETVSFTLAGQDFMAISAGPYFKFNPSVSFLVACTSDEEVNELWAKISEGGTALMELGSYPFSQRYGWTTDTYGLSWQIMHMGERAVTQKITPTLMFVGGNAGKAEEAINFYASVFPNSAVNVAMRYGAGEEPDKEGTVKHASFTLEGQKFAAMDSAHKHEFAFNEAISLLVKCGTQEELDAYWNALSAVPEAEQCGWLKDKFGLSWQISPASMETMMQNGTPEQIKRVTEAFLKMKKFDIEALNRAYAAE